MPIHHLKEAHHKPSGGSSNVQWLWKGGACWPKGTDVSGYPPYGFKSLADFLLFFELTQPDYGQPYSLNGVSTNWAVAVQLPGSGPAGTLTEFLLYLAPHQAPQFWYYLQNNIGCLPPLNNGPVLSGNEAKALGVSYVGIGDPSGLRVYGSYTAPSVTLIT